MSCSSLPLRARVEHPDEESLTRALGLSGAEGFRGSGLRFYGFGLQIFGVSGLLGPRGSDILGFRALGLQGFKVLGFRVLGGLGGVFGLAILEGSWVLKRVLSGLYQDGLRV